VLAAGLAGLTLAVFLQWYCNSPSTANPQAGLLSGYPLVFSGKPYWSLPANIPICFELTVLFSALTAFVGVWALARLPQPYYPPSTCARFRRATDDRFFIIIEARDKKFQLEETRQLLAGTDAEAVEDVMD
jgi:hypothetical protein